MFNRHFLLHRALLPCLFVALHTSALAQSLTITAVSPAANAPAVPRTSSVAITFSQSLTAASAGALKVFSNQRGGLRTRGNTPATVNGSALSFTPSAYPYLPGETVRYSVTVASSSGGMLVRPRTGQFTTATHGTGLFQAGAVVPVGDYPRWVAAGDLDGDGDLDIVTTAPRANRVDVRFNDGRGGFRSGPNVGVGLNPRSLVLGDLDSDGDLDLITGNEQLSGAVSVRFNDGSGTFTGSQNLSLGFYIYGLSLGDVDGDGDLDLVAANSLSNTVSVSLNDGLGQFIAQPNVQDRGEAFDVALGDVDGDGDLDLVTANYSSNAGTVSVRLNDGTGVFSGTQDVPTGSYCNSVVLGDVDGDGDLDLLASNFYSNTVSVRTNNGSGTFGGTQDVPVGGAPFGVAVLDVDGDGDLDLLASTNDIISGTVSVRTNNGSGMFSGTQDARLTSSSVGLATGDVDGDGDVDVLVVNNWFPGQVSVLLNGGPALASTPVSANVSFALFPVPAGRVVTLTGAAPQAAVVVLNALGQVLLTTITDASGTARLALPARLPAGVYFVRNGGQVQRLAVE